MITITKQDDTITVNTITMLIYGQPGSWKTSLGCTTERPLVLDFDGGIYRTPFRKDSVRITTWEDILGLTADDLAPYHTVVVDTVGRLLDALAIYLIQQNPKLGRGAGALTLQGFGELKSTYAAWLKTLLSYGKDILLIAHDREEKDNDAIIVRPDIQGGSYGEVFKRADAIGYMYRAAKGVTLDFNPSERWVGKNAGQLTAQLVPNFASVTDYGAGIIRDIKAALNRMSQENRQALDAVAQWKARCDAATDAAGVNALVAAVSKMNGDPVTAQVKTLIANRATELKLTWEKGKTKGSGQYVPTQPHTA